LRGLLANMAHQLVHIPHNKKPFNPVLGETLHWLQPFGRSVQPDGTLRCLRNN
jgi:hypothetical protein